MKVEIKVEREGKDFTLSYTGRGYGAKVECEYEEIDRMIVWAKNQIRKRGHVPVVTNNKLNLIELVSLKINKLFNWF